MTETPDPTPETPTDPETPAAPKVEPPPIGVEITATITGRVNISREDRIRITAADGTLVVLPTQQITWESSLPEWWPPQFGDLIETSDARPRRFLYTGEWIAADTRTVEDVPEGTLYVARLLRR